MKFLTILIIVFFYRNWLGDNPVRAAVPFERYQSMFLRSSLGGNVKYLLCVAIPAVLLWLVSLEVATWFAGLVWLLVCVLVLAYAIDVYDEELAFDDQLAWLRALGEQDDLDAAVQKQMDFRSRTTYEVFQGLYPGLFWFIFLGPVGVLLFALSCDYLAGIHEEEEDGEEQAPPLAEQVVFWMEWVPARVAGLIFALVGDFGKCIAQWFSILPDTEASISSTMNSLASAAVSAGEDYGADMASFMKAAETEVQELRQVLERALWGWVGLAAIVTVIGW